jgi:hypothetical protein
MVLKIHDLGRLGLRRIVGEVISLLEKSGMEWIRVID